MTQSDKINLTSLNLVHDELVSTIEQAASKLEQFVADMGNAELLQNSIDSIQQISGTLALLQLHGADLLAKELLALANSITIGDSNVEDRLHVLTSAFFILPRYLEYTIQTRRGMPLLLLPSVNEIRQVRGESPLPESYFFEVDISKVHPAPGKASSVLGEDLTALVRRLRHMYQVGMLSVFRDKLIKPSLTMMQRSMQRLAAISGNRPLSGLWWVTSAALEVMVSEQMEVNKSRKLLFGAIDREIKALQNTGLSALDIDPPKHLLKDCIYLLAISGSEIAAVKAVAEAYRYEPAAYVDKELVRERDALRGPSVTTVSSVAAVLKDELNAIKDVLERASQSADMFSDYDELTVPMDKVAEILSVVGLTAPSQALKEEVEKIGLWHSIEGAVDAKSLVEVADAVLYVESTISGLETFNLSDEKLTQANSIARKDVIASSQIAEAEMVVLKEAESGLSLIKRALNSFAESNYDRGHIQNVGATLNTVRGGMELLSLKRGAAVVAGCVEFVEDTLLYNDQPAALQHLLETFADAVIGLEYYVDAVKADKEVDDSLLEIAEESLQALGHPVKPIH